MRIDRLLCRLRFVKTRALAQGLVERGHIRCNGLRVTRSSHSIAIGDVLTLPLGKAVKIVRVTALPERRGPAAEARECYRELDPAEQTAIAAQQGSASKGTMP